MLWIVGSIECSIVCIASMMGRCDTADCGYDGVFNCGGCKYDGSIDNVGCEHDRTIG